MPEMDEAADRAREELLANVEGWNSLDIAQWWAKHYMKAGHKRLGRVLVAIAKKP